MCGRFLSTYTDSLRSIFAYAIQLPTPFHKEFLAWNIAIVGLQFFFIGWVLRQAKSHRPTPDLSSSGEDSTIPSVSIRRPQLGTGVFFAVVALACNMFMWLLQLNGVRIPLVVSSLGYISLTGSVIYAFLRWEKVQNWRRPKQWAVALLVGSTLLAISSWGVWTQYRREHPPLVQGPQPQAHEEPPPIQMPKSTVGPKPKIPKNPLEIVEFRSDHAISIANNAHLSAHVLSLFFEFEDGNKSLPLNLDIGPGKISQQLIPEEEFPHLRTSRMLADTWEGHVKKAKELYGSCGINWTFFSPSDTGFKQVRDHYASQNESFGYKQISGALYYRFEGINKTQEQTVPLIETIAVNQDACPSELSTSGVGPQLGTSTDTKPEETAAEALPKEEATLPELPLVGCRPITTSGTSESISPTVVQAHGGTFSSFVTDGSKDQKINFLRTPKRVLVEPSRKIVDASELPKEITLGKCGRSQLCKVTLLKFADGGVTINSLQSSVLNDAHQLCGIRVKVTVLEAQ